MLQNEIIAGYKNIPGKDPVGQALKPIQSEGRIGEDEIEAFPADREKVKDIVPDRRDILQAQSQGFGLDEGCVLTGHLHGIDARGAAGSEFEGNRPCASEQIENLQVLEFVFIPSTLKSPSRAKSVVDRAR